MRHIVWLLPHWVWIVRRALGQGHICEYENGFCSKAGMHRGRI